jgi:hypothetical protein
MLGNDVCAGTGETCAGAREQFERGIVVDVVAAVFCLDHDTAVAVAGVLAEADVGDEDEFFCGGAFLDGAQALLDDAIVVPGAGSFFVLGIGQAEEQQPADAEGRSLFGFANSLIHGEIEDAGHGAYRIAHALAGTDEERIDQVAGIERGLAHECAKRLSATQTAQAHFRKRHA